MPNPMPRPVLTYQGGKYRLADWIVSFFPPHVRYLEPFGGAASILMNKPRSDFEVYNDLDKRVYAVFKVLQDREKAKELEYRLRYTPYSREEWKEAYAEQDCDDIIETARHTIVRAFMDNSSNGATRKGSGGFGLKPNSSDAVCPNARAWYNYADCIHLFCERLQGVILENKDAITLIKYIDHPDTLHYVDPPYVNSTWSNKGRYTHSIDDEYHTRLIALLKELKGYVVLSGYNNEIYQKELAEWQCYKKETINQLRDKRIECVWLNPKTQIALQGNLLKYIGGGNAKF